MSERIIYTALFVLTLLVIIHSLLHVLEVEHPNIPEWLFPGGLTLTATAYHRTRPATDRPSGCSQRAQSRARGRRPAPAFQNAYCRNAPEVLAASSRASRKN